MSCDNMVLDLGVKSNLDSSLCRYYHIINNRRNNINKTNKTLIIVDPQNDFVSGNLAVNDAKEVMKNIVSELVMGDYTQVIVTVDWHPFNHCSFNTQGGEWPTHCIQHTWGAAIVSNISSMLVELNKRGIGVDIVEKGVTPNKEEYGAFGYDIPQSYIYSKIVNLSDPIYICGVAGDYCVYDTTVNLLKLGFSNIIVLTDCIASIDGGIKLNGLIECNNLKKI